MDAWLYKSLVRPLLFQMDVEEAHNLGHRLLPASRGMMEVVANYHLNGLSSYSHLTETSVAGRALAHPVGLAAGFDKNARLLPELAAMGFSFAEIGSVTALSSPGNPRPRLFRLPKDQAIINRLGLNGDGAEAVSRRLATGFAAGQAKIPLALNIAPTNYAARAAAGWPSERSALPMDEDIAATFACFKELGLAYVTINTSCPNTHEGVLQESSQLRNILTLVQNNNDRHLPVFLKFSPDSTDDFLAHAVAVGGEFGVAGYILGNTSTGRDGLLTPSERLAEIGNGGLSGKPLQPLSLHLVRRVAKLKEPSADIIACGGISTADEIIEVVRAGARAVQIYTALVYEGPFHAIRLHRDLTLKLASMGRSLLSLVGENIS